jgi:hypothetical protein
MSSASWLVGYTTMIEQEPQIGAGDITVVADTYALRHATASLSLIDEIAAQLTAVYGAGYSVVILRNRLVRITLGAAGVITWGSATILRDLLGFTGNRGSATVHTADAVSPLLWSPGFMATPKTIQGVEGYTVSQQAIYTSDDLSQVFGVHYGDGTFQELGWSHILPERMRVATGTGGGTFHEFYEQCAKRRRRFTYYQEIDEDDASSSPVTWTTGMGPYVLREFDGDWYRRNVSNAEISSSLELPLQLVAEVA